MDKALRKFKEFLDSYEKKSKNELFVKLNEHLKTHVYLHPSNAIDLYLIKRQIQDEELVLLMNRLDDIGYIKKLMNLSREEWSVSIHVYNDFEKLSFYIEEANLSSHDSFFLLMHFIDRNVCGFCGNKEAIIIDDEKLLEHKFKGIDREEIKDMLITGELSRVLRADEDSLSKKELYIREEIYNNYQDFIISCEGFIENCLSINEHYIEKKDEFNESDIDLILSSLKNLNVKNSLIESSNRYLKKSFESRSNKNKETIVEKREEYLKSEKKYLTDSEYKKIRKRVYEYYNIHDGIILKQITYDKMLSIVSDMLLLDISTDQIKFFILSVYNTYDIKDMDVMEKYDMFMNKIKEILDEDEYKYVTDIYDEILSSVDEDKELWLSEFSKYINSIMVKLLSISSFDYEIEKARSLCLEA